MKKLVNNPKAVVIDMLRGLVALHPGFSLLAEDRVLFRSDIEAVRNTHVAVISGGGSGHEPAHAGFVGPGMLSAAVAGEVFTSPTPNAVLAAIRQVTGAPGVLLVVKNYTGDRLNFGLAAELARAQNISVETVTVADDVALAGASMDGARGLAGTVLVHKIAGAAAASGWPLREVASAARSAAADLATIGLSLSAGAIPAVGRPSYALADDEIELGLGIHGEPGIRRMPLKTADELAEQLASAVAGAAQFRSSERIAVLVNNLGATTAMELAIFGGRAVRCLQSLGFEIARVYSGAFVTSLDAAGVSLSILRVDDPRLALLDAATAAPAWPNSTQLPVLPIDKRIIAATVGVDNKPRETAIDPALGRALEGACNALIAAEPRLTELDRISGDGDLGLNLARGANAVKAMLSERFADGSVSSVLEEVAMRLQNVVGGSSGPFYGVMLLRAARTMQGAAIHDALRWAQASLDACQGIAELGGAAPGDRTMIDALVPFAAELNVALARGEAPFEALDSAVSAAEAGAESTLVMQPRRGRASYLGSRVIGHPDPGAIAVAIWLRGIAAVR